MKLNISVYLTKTNDFLFTHCSEKRSVYSKSLCGKYIFTMH